MSRFLIILIVAQTLALTCPAQSESRLFRAERWRDPDFSKVNFEPIEAEIRLRRPSEEPDNLSLLARRNLQYLFYNRLNRDHFLVPPRPEDVAERVAALLRLSREIDASIESGRKSFQKPGALPEKQVQRELIRQIEGTAKKLGQQFEEFFMEPREASFSFRVPKSDSDSRFFNFVRQAEQINGRLAREMEFYFLADSPGAIHLSDYQKVTIKVLTESLQRLCKISRRRL